jgi:putative endonuclease
LQKFYTYILKSDLTTKHYYGSCSDLSKRLADHNYGRVKFTKSFKPWAIHYFEEFETKSEALKREKYFKSIDGYCWLKSKGIV